MIIGIFGDTHNHKRLTRQAMRVFEEQDAGLCLHTGDWTWPEFAELYKSETPCDTISALGNKDRGRFIDGENRRGFRTEFHEGIYQFRLDGKKIALYHGHKEAITAELLACQEYDLVATGHDHIPHLKAIGRTYWLNPGHFKVPVMGDYPDYARATVALYDTARNYCEIIELF